MFYVSDANVYNVDETEYIVAHKPNKVLCTKGQMKQVKY